MPTAEKEAIVADVAEQLSKASSIFLTDYKGLNVEEITKLRQAFAGANVEYRVVKNTLAKLSAKSAGCDDIVEYLQGPTALAFGMDDPVAPARVISEFSKKNEKLTVRACLFEGVLFGEERVAELASLPSRDEVLGQLVGVLQAPISNLAYALNGVLSKLVYALDAVKEKKENES